jgi:predicted ATPase/DNA-binding CsgD family transcriptional regulator/transcriptional regulator with XRE-family HTH domain
MPRSPDSHSTFGQWLKRRRRALQLTQDELAARVGYTGASLQKLEQELRRPSQTLATLLANALELADEERAHFFQLASAAPASPAASHLAPSDEAAGPLPASRPQPPSPSIALIGRAAEHTALSAQLRDGRTRLVTLVGPGGIGKTSLALQVAADLAAAQPFPDGVVLVTLAALADAGQVPQPIAETLGVPLVAGRPAAAQLLDALRDRTLLLVLDNCEQLLNAGDGFAELLALLLAGAPGLTVLATSRERLRMRDEQVFALGGLDLPTSDSGPHVARAPAVQLFIERARRVNPGFTPGEDERADVARLCRRLDGLPLAIELAAAWARMLTPREIADEIDCSLDLLTSTARDVVARHRSVRAVLDHSWHLLGDDERRALARLSVVRGSCTREAAEATAGATLPLLSGLVDKSLVRPGTVHGATRYSLHELVRQYAAEQLAADPAGLRDAQSRHAGYYAALLQRTVSQQTGGSSLKAWASLGRELDNVRAAWTWAAAAGDTATVRGMARGLMLLSDQYGWRLDTAELFAQAAESLRPFGPAANAARGLALGLQGYFLLLVRPAAAPPLLREGAALLEAAGDDEGRAELLLHLGTLEIAAANFAAAREHYCLAGQLVEGRTNHFVRLWAVQLRGSVELYTGALAAAEQCFTACLTDWRGQGFVRGVTTALSGLSEAALTAGRLAEAEAHAQEGLRLSSTLRDTPGVGRALHDLGALAVARGDLDEAYYLCVESCTTLHALGDMWPYGLSRAQLVEVEARRGKLADARHGCAELLRLVRDGVAILLPEAAYGLALTLVAEGRVRDALAVLTAAAWAPGKHRTLARIADLHAELARRLGLENRPDAAGPPPDRGALAIVEELCALQPGPAPQAASRPDEPGAPVVPYGALYIAETGETLSVREVEVLGLLAVGKGNQAIAETLTISLHTAKHHVASILQKLGVASRTEAALRGRALGLPLRSPKSSSH